MARRNRLSLAALRRMHPAACESDCRVVQKDGDAMNLAIVYADGAYQQLRLCGPREVELLARQLLWFAAEMQRPMNELEEWEP